MKFDEKEHCICPGETKHERNISQVQLPCKRMFVEFVIDFNPKSRVACSSPAPPTTVLETVWVMCLFGVTIAS